MKCMALKFIFRSLEIGAFIMLTAESEDDLFTSENRASNQRRRTIFSFWKKTYPCSRSISNTAQMDFMKKK